MTYFMDGPKVAGQNVTKTKCRLTKCRRQNGMVNASQGHSTASFFHILLAYNSNRQFKPILSIG